MEIFTEDPFEFWKARIVGDDEGVGVMGGLRRLDGMREEGTGNLLVDEGRGITSVEKGLGEVSGVGLPGDCRCAAPRWLESREWSIWWMRGGSWKNEVLLEVGGFDMDGGVELTMTHT